MQGLLVPGRRRRRRPWTTHGRTGAAGGGACTQSCPSPQQPQEGNATIPASHRGKLRLRGGGTSAQGTQLWKEDPARRTPPGAPTEVTGLGLAGAPAWPRRGLGFEEGAQGGSSEHPHFSGQSVGSATAQQAALRPVTLSQVEPHCGRAPSQRLDTAFGWGSQEVGQGGSWAIRCCSRVRASLRDADPAPAWAAGGPPRLVLSLHVQPGFTGGLSRNGRFWWPQAPPQRSVSTW